MKSNTAPDYINNTSLGIKQDTPYSDPYTEAFEYEQRQIKKPTKRPAIDERRRKQRGRYCIKCGKYFTGHGARFTADNHQFWTGHEIISGELAVTYEAEAAAKKVGENENQAQ